MKVAIDVSNPNEENRALGLEIKVLFQGEPFEDPNPPEEEDPKKKKGAAEPEVRIITPDPILLEQESGRLFEFELGRNEAFKADGDDSDRAKTPVSNNSKETVESVKVWKNYKFDVRDSTDLNVLRVPT